MTQYEKVKGDYVSAAPPVKSTHFKKRKKDIKHSPTAKYLKEPALASRSNAAPSQSYSNILF